MFLSGKRALLGVLFAFAFQGAARSDEPAEWKVGLAKAVITPSERMQLAGYGGRVAQFQNVEHDLHAKVAVFEDKDGRRGALITADLIGFFGDISQAICERIQTKTGLPRECILLNASHTHAGPELTVGRGTDDDNGARVERYVEELTAKVSDAVALACEKMQPATLSYGRGVESFAMNRREFTHKGAILGVQPSGLVDRSVPVLLVKGENGKPLAVIFGAACHNTTLTGENLAVSGDYAGFAQYAVANHLSGVQAMFVQGCGGDANPYPRGTMDLAKEHGEALAREVLRLTTTELRHIRGPLRTLYSNVDLPLERIATRAEAEKLAESPNNYHRDTGKALLARFDRGQTPQTHYRAPLALWQFGDDLTLVAISGETVVDYVKMTEKAIGPLNLWVAGYSNDVFGYLPSARILAEGGYETRGLIRGGIGLFAPEAQEVIVKQLTAMAHEAGRDLP